MASFKLPELQESPEVWGPPSTSSSGSSSSTARTAKESVLPAEFRSIPFTPFAKSDKIGRFADWNSLSGTHAQADGGRNAGAGAGGEDGRGMTGANGMPIRGAAAGLRGVAGGQAGGRRNDGLQTLGAGASTFTYFHGSDEASFSIVDNARASAAKRGGLSQMTRGRGGAGRGGNMSARGGAAGAPGAPGRGGYAARGGGRGGAAAGARGGAGGMANARGGRRPGYRDWDRPQRTREPSVIVGADWEQVEEIEFTRLQKLRLDVNEGEDLTQVGTLYEYDRSYDRITSVRFEKPLRPMERVRYSPTTSDDPILQGLAAKPAVPSSDEKKGPATRIFVTDSILAMLMCATRTVYPWDIVITRDSNGNVFMDKRDGGAFDYVTVNENAYDPPSELEIKDGEGPRDKAQAINTPGNLSLEATYINQNFAFQVVNEKKAHTLPDGPNPFYDVNTEKEQLASCAYRYRKFDLSTPDHDVELYVRAELDAINVSAVKGQPNQYITIKTLNEFDSKAQGSGGAPDWRTKLDSQRGAVVATEIKNNGVKLARFAVQSILARADNMKMGYVSRLTSRDSTRHVILGTQWYKPRDFAANLNVNFSNGWGIVRTIADLISKPKEGEDKSVPAKFVLAKDPNKPLVRLYKVPLTWPAVEEEENADAVLDSAAVSTVNGGVAV